MLKEIFNNPRKNLIKRIKANIKKVHYDNDVKGDCWIWQGGNSGKGLGSGRGYGRISVKGCSSAVHRIMYICVNGFIPSKIHVDHICVNRLCCNPKHLQAVTHKKNCKLRDERNKKPK